MDFKQKYHTEVVGGRETVMFPFGGIYGPIESLDELLFLFGELAQQKAFYDFPDEVDGLVEEWATPQAIHATAIALLLAYVRDDRVVEAFDAVTKRQCVKLVD